MANELIVSDTLTQLRARSAFFKMIKDDLCKGMSFKRGEIVESAMTGTLKRVMREGISKKIVTLFFYNAIDKGCHYGFTITVQPASINWAE